ncbi:hypothetical protein SAMN05216338_101749 [Bradyrhizobium sp. Rc2d]|nr:hypothetical protein SAMN05216338_101749 [Bradyrhizobium sp. Rc2d]
MLAMDENRFHEVHLVRVTTDDREWRLWLAATPREEAVERVLDVIPEGWTAVLLDELDPTDAAILFMKPGEVREVPR